MKQYELPEIKVDVFDVGDILSVSEPPEESSGYPDFTTPESPVED